MCNVSHKSNELFHDTDGNSILHARLQARRKSMTSDMYEDEVEQNSKNKDEGKTGNRTRQMMHAEWH